MLPAQLELPSLQECMSMFEERLADPNDLGSRHEFIHNSESVIKARLAIVPQHHPDFDGKSCLDCGSGLPEERLEWGRIRCVDCQTATEKPNTRYRN